MTADQVADALLAVLARDRTGEAWYVQPGRPAEPFVFRNVPGSRAPGRLPGRRSPRDALIYAELAELRASVLSIPAK